MTSTELDLLVPLETQLPPLANDEVLSQSQWATLVAIADTLIPSIEASTKTSHARITIANAEYTGTVNKLLQVVPEQTGERAVQKYLEENASSVSGFTALLQRTFTNYIRDDAIKGIRVMLSALE